MARRSEPPPRNLLADSGNATIEFLALPMLLLPLMAVVLHLLAALQVQSAVDEAARQAVRAAELHWANPPAAAITAARLALADARVRGRVARSGADRLVITASAGQPEWMGAARVSRTVTWR